MFSSNERALQITPKTKDSGSIGYSMMVLESPQTRDHCHIVIGSSGQWFTKPHPYSIAKKTGGKGEALPSLVYPLFSVLATSMNADRTVSLLLFSGGGTITNLSGAV